MSKEFLNLSNPQHSIWITEQFYNHTDINHICGIFNFNDVISVEVLKQAINKLVEQNDALRLRIIMQDSKPMQYVADFESFTIPAEEVSNEKELDLLKEKMVKEPFEIIDSPLFRFTIFQFPDGKGGYVVTVHHLAADAMTLGLIGNKTYEIYEKLINHEEPEENTTFSYVQYLETEKEYLSSEKYKKDETYWNELYTTVPETATMPANISKPSNDATANREVFEISQEKTAQIKDYCKEHKISLYHFFMAIFSLYLGRISNLDDFVIGTPILNRTNFKEKNTLGMFISNLPFRVTIHQDQTFSEYVNSMAVQLTTMLRHQRYPYQYLLENLRKKDASLPNLYNITLSYQITKASSLGSGCTTDWIPADTIADDMAIHFYDLDYNGNVNIAYDYRVAKYTKEEITCIQRRIEHIINQILINHNIIMKNITIVTPEEKYQILHEFNNTKTDYPSNKTIIALFEEQVEKIPENTAVVFEDQKLTYRELNEKANGLASLLLSRNYHGVIGVHLEKNIDYIIAILSILKAGCTFLPISTSLPSDRIVYMLTNSNTSAIISVTALLDSLPNMENTICLDQMNLSKKPRNPDVAVNNQHLAYILYTSGSTGTPKGVMVKDTSLINHVWGINQRFHHSISSDDIALSVANISFDANIQEIFIPLLLGACVHLLENDAIYDIHYLANYIVKNKITFSFIPPTILDDLYELLKHQSISLNKLLVGVEPISTTTLNHYLTLNEEMVIHNGYGPTEATICCISYRYDHTSSDNKIAPIGNPMQNTNAFIMNPETLQLQPPYAIGEIFISGDCVSEGYINHADLTTKNFVSIPYSDTKAYRTGDFAYYLPNGNIMFVGRMDSQVKTHGYRIELNEINTIVQSFPQIKKSITILSDRNLLYTYIISDTDTINIAELKKYLKTKLPAYMLPSNILQITQLPITINGKLNRDALIHLIENKQEVKVKKEPATAVQKELLSICEQLMQKNDISIDDDLFEIGADSLTAIRLSAFMKQTFNIDITVKTIFENSSIELLSSLIPSNIVTTSTRIQPIGNSQEYYPLSSAQKRIYFSSNISGKDSTLYNMPGGVLLDKIPDITILENCMKTLINRHESLRTSFHIVNGTIMQKVNDTISSFSLEIVEGTLENKYTIFKQFVKPFDLSDAPLLHLQLVKFEDDSCMLLFDTHHIISDGLSMQIFVQELSKLYNNIPLSKLQFAYKDYAVWEESYLLSEQLTESKAFWMEQYKELPPLLDLPTDYMRPNPRSYQGANIYKDLDFTLSKQIAKFVKKQNVTPYMFFLATYYILLYYYTLQTDIVVGSPVMGRDQIELSNIIGMFVNTLALRNQIDIQSSFHNFLMQVKENCMQAFSHQTYPFNELVNQLNITRDSSRNPLFDTTFIYQNTGYEQLSFQDIIATYYIPDSSISKFDLSLEVIPDSNMFKLRFEYCTDLFKPEFIDSFANNYIELVKTVLTHSNHKIEELTFLSTEEEDKILHQFNNTKMNYPSRSTLPIIFEEQVKKTPDHYAIYFEGVRLTYSELNRKANQLAHYLISNQVQRGDVVCLLLDKSVEMIIAILGILKAGAAFLPIDINYPKERIDYILADSKSKLLLTTSSLINKANATIKAVTMDAALLDGLPVNNPLVLARCSDLAYIMYTSGSTGTPKGVMVTHQNILRLVINTNYITLSPEDRILQTGSIVFDACTFEIWAALLNGLELYIIPKEILLDTNLLQNYLIRHKISVLWLTAPLFNQLSEDNPHMFSTVRCLLTGGDVLSPKHINLVQSANPNLTIINGYGPTENTTFSCCFTVDQAYSNNIPIGYPIANSTCYVVSSTGHLLPVGVPGELWVGGDGVAQGYWNNPKLTEEKFIQNPFAGGMLYKTGDLVRWLPNGSIEFLGRMDSQVKIRGFRVELTEINSVILDYPGIQDSYTTTKIINDEKQICAYIVSASPINISDLKLHLKKTLPNYMIPNHFMQLTKLPLNQNGKIDKALLPTEFNSITKETLDSEKPSTKEEKILLAIFKKILNVSDIGITDNFFDLGGDSLSAMKVHVEALSHDLNINYANIFQYPTVKELARSIYSNNTNQNLESYDYSKYDTILSNNTLANITDLPYKSIKNILLTGFTGFLGAHVLDSFIRQEKGIIYCLIRSKNNMTAEERLKNILHFYFDTKYDKYIGKRIRLVEGDITYEHLGLSPSNYSKLGKNISTVIHCAALVKHFGSYNEFQNINIYGTQQVIDLCKQYHLHLLHISTISVSGNVFAEESYLQHNFTEDVFYDETNFYIGQNLDNFYVKSKFFAEKLVFDAILDGLPAYVIRMGNLTSRFTEGKFQQNHFENAFVNRFKSILQIKKAPDYLLDGYVEFTPIDCCGDAIIKLATHFNKNFSVFHLLNQNHVDMSRLFHTMKSLNIDIDLVSSEEFVKIINTLLHDDEKKSYLEGIINDLDENKKLVYESPVKINSDFSCELLKKIGFEWPYIDERYIKNYLKYLADIGYFNIQIN